MFTGAILGVVTGLFQDGLKLGINHFQEKANRKHELELEQARSQNLIAQAQAGIQLSKEQTAQEEIQYKTRQEDGLIAQQKTEQTWLEQITNARKTQYIPYFEIPESGHTIIKSILAVGNFFAMLCNCLIATQQPIIALLLGYLVYKIGNGMITQPHVFNNINEENIIYEFLLSIDYAFQAVIGYLFYSRIKDVHSLGQKKK